jgi:hypothetical protein
LQKVELPIDVYQAFERLKRNWRNLLKEEDLDLIFLNVNQIAHTGDLVILKKYAQTNPTKYIKALANGYVAQTNPLLVKEVNQMLDEWLSTPPFLDDVKNDRYEFSKKLVEYVEAKIAK